MALHYADASALVKLIVDEPESRHLRAFLDDGDIVSCDMVRAELPRAVRRAAAREPGLDLDRLLAVAGQVIDSIALAPIDRDLLDGSGALVEPSLRALDAIYVAAAVGLLPIDGFVTYDQRQAAGARLAGLRTVSPGIRQEVAP